MQRNILDILHTDHESISVLFGRLARQTPDRQDTFDRLVAEITAHTRGEEYAFYPRLQDHPEAGMLVPQALQQHREIENLLTRLKNESMSGREWEPIFREVRNRVEQHVLLEENNLFPVARRVLSNQQLDSIAGEFSSEKQQVLNRLITVRR